MTKTAKAVPVGRVEPAGQDGHDDLETERRALLDERNDLWVQRDEMRPGGTSGPIPLKIAFLRLEERLEEIEDQLAEVDRQIDAKRRAEIERITAERAPGRRELLRKVVESCEAVCQLGSAVEAYDRQTAELTGLMPAAHPAPSLLPGGAVAYQVEQLRRQLAPREDPGPPPVREGQRRLRLSARLFDREGPRHFLPGDVADFPEATAQDLIERGIAEEIAFA